MNVWYLLATAIMMLANGFFVASEIALTAAQRSRIEEMAAGGGIRARAALQAMRDLPLMYASAQLGITMASLGLGLVTESVLAGLIRDLIGRFGNPSEALAHGIAVPIALLLVALGHMIVGEMVPKNAAVAAPERVLLWVAVPFRAFSYLFWVVLWVLNLAARAGLRLFRVEMKQELLTSYSAAEIALMLEDLQEQGAIGTAGHDLVRRRCDRRDRAGTGWKAPHAWTKWRKSPAAGYRKATTRRWRDSFSIDWAASQRAAKWWSMTTGSCG